MLRLLGNKPYHHLAYFTTTTASPLRSPPFVIDPTLTLYFLQKSCKLSPSAAAAASKEINLKNTKNAHAVLSLLRDFGFSEAQITRLISRRPKMLLTCPSRTLKPKLDFYTSVGLSIDDFTNHVCARARLLCSSARNRFAPNFDLLGRLLPSQSDVLATIRRYPAVFLTDLQKIVPFKTDLLLDHGIPMNAIIKMIAMHPSALIKFDVAQELQSSLADLKELGINPSSKCFVHAFAVFFKVSKQGWNGRVQNYASRGWSMDQLLSAFACHPYCLSSSIEKVNRNADFFEEKFGWGPAKLSSSPVLLSLSLENRIVPRYSVFKILEDRRILDEGITPHHFMLGEKKFWAKYVDGYQETVPEILEAISGKLGTLPLELRGR